MAGLSQRDYLRVALKQPGCKTDLQANQLVCSAEDSFSGPHRFQENRQRTG